LACENNICRPDRFQSADAVAEGTQGVFSNLQKNAIIKEYSVLQVFSARFGAISSEGFLPRHCLVFLESPVVARDLALTMQDIAGCGPIIAGSIDEAEAQLEALPQGAPLPYAFVHLSPSAFASSRLNQLLNARGAKVVLTGHAAELEAGGDASWPVLLQPFSSAQVEDLITRLAV